MIIISRLPSFKHKLIYKIKISAQRKMKLEINKKSFPKKSRKLVVWRKLSQLNPQKMKN